MQRRGISLRVLNPLLAVALLLPQMLPVRCCCASQTLVAASDCPSCRPLDETAQSPPAKQSCCRRERKSSASACGVAVAKVGDHRDCCCRKSPQVPYGISVRDSHEVRKRIADSASPWIIADQVTTASTVATVSPGRKPDGREFSRRSLPVLLCRWLI